jgi:hypothetical protein
MIRKELIDRLFSTGRRLARGLLRPRRRIVTDTLLYALVIYGIGCVIPTPLDPQQAPPDYAPVILTATPAFGPISVTQDQLIPLKITIDDPSDIFPGTQDVLHAGLFVLDQVSNKLVPLSPGSEFVITPASSDPANSQRDGNITVSPCVLLSGQTFYLYVVVANRGFSTTDPSTVVTGGQSSSNYWVVKCI